MVPVARPAPRRPARPSPDQRRTSQAHQGRRSLARRIPRVGRQGGRPARVLGAPSEGLGPTRRPGQRPPGTSDTSQDAQLFVDRRANSGHDCRHQLRTSDRDQLLARTRLGGFRVADLQGARPRRLDSLPRSIFRGREEFRAPRWRDRLLPGSDLDQRLGNRAIFPQQCVGYVQQRPVRIGAVGGV